MSTAEIIIHGHSGVEPEPAHAELDPIEAASVDYSEQKFRISIERS